MTDTPLNLTKIKRIVIKIGSALLTKEGKGLDEDFIKKVVIQIQKLHQLNKEIIIISSGAIVEGWRKLGYTSRPQELPDLQACSAVGQIGLMKHWKEIFDSANIPTATLLLSYNDIFHWPSYNNVSHMLEKLAEHKVVPVINENDAVSLEEIQFGDNDTLSGFIANIFNSDLLILLTDQQGLFTEDPRVNANAELITQANTFDQSIDQYATPNLSIYGRGGMQTKLNAARIVGFNGTPTVIISGNDDSLEKFIESPNHQQSPKTLLQSNHKKKDSLLKRFLISHQNIKQSIQLKQPHNLTYSITYQDIALISPSNALQSEDTLFKIYSNTKELIGVGMRHPLPNKEIEASTTVFDSEYMTTM